MNFLHCFYGIGVSLSPYLMSLALADGNQWRLGYRRAFFVQAVIVLVIFLSLPLWKKTRPAVSGINQEAAAERNKRFAAASFRIVVILYADYSVIPHSYPYPG